MGMTMAEKIIACAAGVESTKAGDIETVTLDRLMSNDGTTHLTIDMYNNKLKHPHIADVSKLVWIVDHNIPADSPKTAASQKKMRDFAREHGITFYEGEGVCHQVMMEKHVRPGELIFGAFPHLRLWRTGRLRYRCRLHGLSVCHGDGNLLASGAGDHPF